MNAQRRQQIEEIYGRALTLGTGERTSHLARACGNDPENFLSRRTHVLRASVEKPELSFSRCVFAAAPALSPSAAEMVTPVRQWIKKQPGPLSCFAGVPSR
jgi:hypothetical protein